MKTITLITIVIVLAGCQSSSSRNNIELPKNDIKHDMERISPCACIDYTELMKLG